MELIKRLWKDFKLQPEIWFFYGFLLTFTLTVRKVLWFFPLRGEFNEYAGVYLYLSDIFLGLTIIAWIITILYNKIDILSMLRNTSIQNENATAKKMFHTCPVAKKCSTWNISFATGVEQFKNLRSGTMLYVLLPLALVTWSFISLIWAENKFVATFRSVKILEFYLLYIFVLVRLFFWNVPRPPRFAEIACRREAGGTILNKIFRLIMIIGSFQAIVGIFQFILQHSVGLFWLKESLISSEIAGVAKVIFNGEAFIRSYGLFPHPNILGGFLLFSILISVLYYKMFHVEQHNKSDIVSHGTIFKLLLGIQLLALILTFSKSAILGLFLGLVFYVYKNFSPWKECSMWNILRGTYGTIFNFLKNNIKKFSLICLIFLIIVFIAKPDFYSLFFKGLDERSVYVNVSPARLAMQSIAGGRGTTEDLKVLFFGIGNSQFVLSIENLSVIVENWMLEPVHNVLLLFWNELGLIGLLILLLFIWHILKLFHSRRNVPCGTSYEANVEQFQNIQERAMEEIKNTFGAIFISLLFIMFFDHYSWDIQQGSFLLWLTLGFLVGAGEYKHYLTK